MTYHAPTLPDVPQISDQLHAQLAFGREPSDELAAQGERDIAAACKALRELHNRQERRSEWREEFSGADEDE